jgi:hypothetical protein
MDVDLRWVFATRTTARCGLGWFAYRVAVCENMMFSGEFHPVLAKHSKNFSLLNALSIGIDATELRADEAAD